MSVLSQNKDFIKYIPSEEKEAYISAVRDFTKMTIQDPSFFEKTPEEQVSIARAILKVKKGEMRNLKEEKNKKERLE